MLILTRKPGESIIARIGDTRIKIVVLESRDYRASLGFDAPADVIIYREELADVFEKAGSHVND